MKVLVIHLINRTKKELFIIKIKITKNFEFEYYEF